MTQAAQQKANPPVLYLTAMLGTLRYIFVNKVLEITCRVWSSGFTSAVVRSLLLSLTREQALRGMCRGSPNCPGFETLRV